MARSWRPREDARKEFAQKMRKIDEFCAANNISHVQSVSGDSYTFQIDGQAYRVANHRVDTSGNRTYNVLGEQIQHNHQEQAPTDIIHIHASKTRIVDIYNNLKAGLELDRRGNVKG